MAVDSKYGRVTLERSTIGEDEPVVVFRAQDKLLPKVLAFYKDLCEQNGSPQHHLDLIDSTWNSILDWQKDHHSQIPQSADHSSNT